MFPKLPLSSPAKPVSDRARARAPFPASAMVSPHARRLA